MTPETIDAAERLRAGALVAFPTETVYGLGADALSPSAVARVFAAKGRPRFNPLISHVPTMEAAQAEAAFGTDAERLAAAFWPGPLTLILPRKADGGICDLARAGLATVGLRVPDHPLALDLLRATGRPIAAPSANRSGRLSPTCADDVGRELGESVDLVLDGGPCRIGLESTIVGCIDGKVRLLRAGGISREAIEEVVGRRLLDAGTDITAPGQLASHYAPDAIMRLDVTDLGANEVGLDFGGRLRGATFDLSPDADLSEAAANLYGHLRALDARGARVIAVAPIPEEGLGAAINDRLRRAAAPRQRSSEYSKTALFDTK